MLAGQNPFEADDEDSTFKNIKDKKAVFPKHFSQEAMDVITSVSIKYKKYEARSQHSISFQFLAKKPNNRLGAGRYARSEVTTHPFYRNIDWDKAEAREMEPPIVPKIVSYKLKAHYQ